MNIKDFRFYIIVLDGKYYTGGSYLYKDFPTTFKVKFNENIEYARMYTSPKYCQRIVNAIIKKFPLENHPQIHSFSMFDEGPVT